MAGRIDGKVCLITGVSGAVGQGRASALLFAQEGAKVAATDVDPSGERTVEEIREHGGDAVFYRADLTNEEEVRNLVRSAVDRYGRLDVLYNNASRGVRKPLLELTKEEWNFTLENELTLVFLVCKYGLPELINGGGGVVINIASTAGLRGSTYDDMAVHSAAKGGVISLTRQLAAEFGKRGIRANVICPGRVETHKTSRRFSDTEFRKLIIAETLVGRLAQPEDISRVALFLASDEAAFMTGTVVIVDGGMTV